MFQIAMKNILKSILVIALMSASVHAAELFQPQNPKAAPPKAKAAPTPPAAAVQVPATSDWYNNVSIEPVGVLKAKDITGPSQWGAGLDIGYKLNDSVSIHVANLSFEGPNNQVVRGHESGGKQTSSDRLSSQSDWGGLLVDETILEFRADLTKFRSERFIPYVTASGQREWNDLDWGFRVGLGAELNISKYVKLAGGYRVGAWKKAGMDSLADLRLVIPIP